MFNKRLLLVVCSLFLAGFSAAGQTRKELEKQRKRLKAEIVKVNQLIFDTQKTAKNALEDLSDLNKKIEVRNQLIATINLESKLLTKEIKSNEKKAEKLTKQLEKIKKEYAEMIYKSYKSRSQHSKTMFLLSSKNVYQAYKRLSYMKQYTSFRKKQGNEIVLQTDFIQQMNDSLFVQKQVKDTLILSEKEEKEHIEADKKTKNTLISEIKKKEKTYKKQLHKKIEEEKRIAEKIDKIIKDAIARANKKSSVKKSNKNEFTLSPEAKALAVKFEQNKGKLPWPLKEGLITRKFGLQSHPTLRGITINSTGLHFVTKKGAFAKCVFNGKVLAIQLTSEGRKNVLVQHGNYITAYFNLENSFVETGDSVITGQELGKVFRDKVSGKTKLIFVLFKNTKRLNPISWIAKR